MNSNNFFNEYERDTRRAFSLTQRNELWDRQNGKCAKCRKPLLRSAVHFDHKTPWEDGGKTEVKNGQALCPNCHTVKNNKDRLKKIDSIRKPKSDNANTPSSNIKAVKDIFDQFSKTRKTDTSENTKAAKQEKPISKRELLNKLSREKLIKIAEKLNVCSEIDRYNYEKESYVNILLSSRKVTVEKIKEILGK